MLSSLYSPLIIASVFILVLRLFSHQEPTTTTTTYDKYSDMRIHVSHKWIVPSHKMTRSSIIATVKKPTSRRNGIRSTWNGLMIHMDPTTQETMNDAAPSSSPIAKLPESARMAENVENTSGEPFPNARKVTPATFSSKPRSSARVARLGQKKSEALIPRVENKNMSQKIRPINVGVLREGVEQK